MSWNNASSTGEDWHCGGEHHESKQTVSSTSVRVLSFHHTMSDLRCVAAMWVGNE